MKGIGSAQDRVTCEFTKDSFDLRVTDFNNSNYRLLKRELYKVSRFGLCSNPKFLRFSFTLSKEIDPSKSKYKVKADRIVITLRKTEGEFGPEHWTDLVEKNKALKKIGKNKDDPTAGLMDLMKQMYDDVSLEIFPPYYLPTSSVTFHRILGRRQCKESNWRGYAQIAPGRGNGCR